MSHLSRVRALLALLALSSLSCAGDCSGIKRRLYEPPDRDVWQQPERVIQALAIRPGQHVADLGAGGGYFTFPLAAAVGPAGRVYAVDVDPDMTRFLEEKAAAGGHGNVEVILARPEDPGLPQGGIDLIFSSNTYHHLEQPAAYFRRARRTLRLGGRVAIVEHKPEGWFQRIFPHSTRSDVIRSEMEAAGYRLEHEHDFLPRQSFLIFGVAQE